MRTCLGTALRRADRRMGDIAGDWPDALEAALHTVA